MHRSLLLQALTFVALATVSLVSSAGAAPPTCLIVNTGAHAYYSNLQDAVDSSTTQSGDRLTVRGTCTGDTRIPYKNLSIRGKSNPAFGPATLEGRLEIGYTSDHYSVDLSDLVIRGGDREGLSAGNGAHVTIEHSTISGSFGIFSYGAEITLSDSTVTESRIGIGNAWGGFVANGSTISGNQYGVTNEGDVVLNRSTVSGNTGGGISVGLGSVTINSSVISGNSTAESGGGILENGGGILNSGDLTITDSIVRNNTATGRGGGIYNWPGVPGVFEPGRLTMTATRVTDNTAAIGGGVYSETPIILIGSGNVLCPNTPDDPPVPCS